ncbi:MAG TPA: septal ring lytic transglycosylase RlpA family protein [Gaiellaceae bacterium]|nr:septal ring lytic transglycosylase RlpA family protein [Gaiellaceae bacterium]
MRPRLAQRELALGGVALLGAAVALAVTGTTRHTSSTLPEPEGSYAALAGPSGETIFGRHTACGIVIGEDTVGIAHPTLPCGTWLYVSYQDTHVLAQVIDRGPYEPGRAFDVTDALAGELGLDGVRTVRWSYARAP